MSRAWPATPRGIVAAAVVASLLSGGLAQAASPPYPGPTPRAVCGPGSHPEPGRQGRMTAAAAAGAPYFCNVQQLSQFGAKGGYKVERYVDAAGHECAYYDTTLLFPKDAVTAGQDLTGVYVLDMSDPSHPTKTATLSTPAMQSPHESMALNHARGLLAAVTGNPAFYPGFADVYDVSADCRNPQLRSSEPSGVMGHEGNWAPDGKTFYSAGWYSELIAAIDVSNPMATVPLWVGSYGREHGLSISDDGNRAYLATNNGLVIIDVSQIQARVTNPQVTQISTITWPTMSTPQATIPVTIHGHKYLIEHDEFGGGSANIGAARIIDIADEKNPVVVSNIKLEVNMPENQADQANDPGAGTIFRGYAAHYCEVPRRQEPAVLACTFILSGLRLFDIRDPFNPKEIAYFAPVPHQANPGSPTSVDPSTNYSMSKPAFVPERGEVWFSDGNSGFYALRLTNSAGDLLRSTAAATTPPTPAAAASPAAKAPSPAPTQAPTLPNTAGWSPPILPSAILLLLLALWRARPRRGDDTEDPTG